MSMRAFLGIKILYQNSIFWASYIFMDVPFSTDAITGSKSASIRMVVFMSSSIPGSGNGPFIEYNADGKGFDDMGGEKDWLRWWARYGMHIGQGI
jgi:hypothetical protein